MRTPGDDTDRPWRKPRLAARILFRKEAGRMTARDRRLARVLAQDPEVTNRLIQKRFIRSDTRASALETASMSSTKTWDWWHGEVDWDTPAGRLLRSFFARLPTDRNFHFVLYGSAPLQLTLNRTWTSADVDFYSDDDEDYSEQIRRLGLAKGQVGSRRLESQRYL